MGRIFSIMSGKGGVGKSTLAVALAEFYAREGRTVALLDGDIGLRCADLMMDMQNQVVFDLGDVAEKSCELEQALVTHPRYDRIKLLAAPQMLDASEVKKKVMGAIILKLADQSDILLLDAPAGVGRGLKNLLGSAAEPVIVATPDDICIRAAERLSSILSQLEEPRPTLVINRINRRMVYRGEMRAPEDLAHQLDLYLAGVIPESKKIYQALLRHESALECGDKSVSNAIEVIGARLLGADAPLPIYDCSPILRFFDRRGEA